MNKVWRLLTIPALGLIGLIVCIFCLNEIYSTTVAIALTLFIVGWFCQTDHPLQSGTKTITSNIIDVIGVLIIAFSILVGYGCIIHDSFYAETIITEEITKPLISFDSENNHYFVKESNDFTINVQWDLEKPIEKTEPKSLCS